MKLLFVALLVVLIGTTLAAQQDDRGMAWLFGRALFGKDFETDQVKAGGATCAACTVGMKRLCIDWGLIEK